MSMTDADIWSSDYDLAMPLLVTLDDGRVASCETVVRAMPGRRYVCKGSYDGQAAFIKLFSLNHRARREWKTEQQGIATLQAANIAAPTILFAGSNRDNTALIIIYAELSNAESTQARWEKADTTQKRQLIDDLVALVAEHHAAGLHHTDLHLLNFIYSATILYTLDAGDIKKSASELSDKQSISGLADLLALFPVEYDEFISEYYSHYCQVRGYSLASDALARLKQKVIIKRKYKSRKYLKKIFRSCSAFVAEKNWRRYVVYDRLLATDALRTLLRNPDKVTTENNATIIKDGNTCTVFEFEQDQRQLVCKRYNIKNIGHALSRAFRASRGSASWRNAHHLLDCGIATARPIALYEQRYGPLRSKTWLFMEKITGADPLKILTENSMTDEADILVESFVQLFRKMVLEQISHGDMKITNFIFSQNRLYVIDLDSMKAHDNQVSFARAFSRDMRRFFRNWHAHPAISNQFHESLRATCVAEYLPGKV